MKHELKKLTKKLESEIEKLERQVQMKLGSEETYWRNVGLLMAKVEVYEKLVKIINEKS
jgi:uncharacterized protein Yka (UPF0111/DUF47 family)